MPLVEDKQVFALCFEAGEGEDAVLWGAPEVVLNQVHPFGGLTFQGHGGGRNSKLCLSGLPLKISFSRVKRGQ